MFGRGDRRGGRKPPAQERRRRSESAETAGEELADAPVAAVAEPPAPQRLVDLAGPWLALIAALRACADLPDPVRLRDRALALRTAFEKEARDRGIGDADLQAATFSLAAFFDEVVRRGRGRARDEWISRPLQAEWFNTTTAGVEFYDRLEELRRDRGKRIEALEVATACVALGFEGKLAVAREKRVALLGDLLADITAVRGAGEAPLAPHVFARDHGGGGAVPELPRWISAAAFALVALLLWLGISQLSNLAAVRAVHEINRPLPR